MDKNKIIILALIVIIAALLVGIFSAMPNYSKEDTKLRIATNSTIDEGDYIRVKLTDLNKTPIANQTVNITITDKDNSSSHYSAVTNDKGVAKLKGDIVAGEYSVASIYGGNDSYAGSNATKNITVEKKVSKAEITSSSTTTNTHTVMGEDGYYYTVDENGNFLESLGPSQKHYPNNPNSVNYPDAEPAWNYVHKGD